MRPRLPEREPKDKLPNTGSRPPAQTDSERTQQGCERSPWRPPRPRPRSVDGRRYRATSTVRAMWTSRPGATGVAVV